MQKVPVASSLKTPEGFSLKQGFVKKHIYTLKPYIQWHFFQ